jgi:tRNA(Ser,Leu) C12 N-acetylase TAN1
MMFVKSAEPRVFITCDVGKEEVVCDDVKNILFTIGVDVECRSFGGKGFAVVYLGGDIDVFKVVRTLVSRFVRGYWVIPIDKVCRSSYEEVAKCATEVVLLKDSGLPLHLVGVCRKRGFAIDSCSNLLRYVGEKLESLGIAVVDFKDYDYVLRIEVVYEDTFLSLYRKEQETLFRVQRR